MSMKKKKKQWITKKQEAHLLSDNFFFVLAHAGLAWGHGLRQQSSITIAENLPHSYESRALILDNTSWGVF